MFEFLGCAWSPCCSGFLEDNFLFQDMCLVSSGWNGTIFPKSENVPKCSHLPLRCFTTFVCSVCVWFPSLQSRWRKHSREKQIIEAEQGKIRLKLIGREPADSNEFSMFIKYSEC